MLELKNNKHNTYYCCTYLYIVNAVIFKLLLTSYLKRDLAKKTKKQYRYHFNMSYNICACKGSAWSSCSIFSGSELIWQYWWTCCFGKGRGSTEKLSKLFDNHNALGQLTNHNTFCFLEGGPSSNPELIEPFVPGWGERYCNNVNYVKNNAYFKPPNMRACSSTPPKQNQDFVKEHNRTPLM